MMSVLIGVSAFIGLTVLFLSMVVLRGWVLSVQWGWFIVPIFGLPALSIPQAVGFALVVGVITFNSHAATNNDTAKNFAVGAVALVLSLGIGWIVKGFM